MKLRRRGINSSGRLASRKSYIIAMAMAMAMARSDLKGSFFMDRRTSQEKYRKNNLPVGFVSASRTGKSSYRSIRDQEGRIKYHPTG